MQAKSHLEQARASSQQVKDALLSGSAGDALHAAQNAKLQAEAAQKSTRSVPWTVAASLPLIGTPFETTKQITDVVAGLATEILVPAAEMGSTVSPEEMMAGNRVDLQLLRIEEPRLRKIAESAALLDRQAQEIAAPAYIGFVRDARVQIQGQVSRLEQLLGSVALAARLAPSMMGADGPRSYLMAFQTNAEARGTGGLVGAFAVLRFDNGAPALDSLTTNLELQDAKAAINLGPEFDKAYEWTRPYLDFRNSNLSPHFPYPAQIWRSMWQEKSGMAVDGVIAIDPVALSYLLAAVGPVTMPDGEVINAENVVELTQATVYRRFPEAKDQEARKEYLQSIAREIARKATEGVPAPQALLEALGKAVGEGRISVWVANPADQELLEATPLAHVVPDDDAPYAQVVINNLSGTKMDYYLKREIEYQADGCDGDMRNSTITVRLTNTATATSVPPYYAETTVWPSQYYGGPVLNHYFKVEVPPGTMIYSVRLIATKNSSLMSVTSNGERISALRQVDRGHPSFEVQVAIPPGQSGELTFRLSEPTSPGKPRVPVQPLIDDVVPIVSVPVCQ